MTTERYDVTIVGSGFAGSLLGRILASNGWKVLLVERGRHPRFAIGESSTPLANLALERLGRRYGFDDLVQLAAHGRWLEAFPEVGRGLKRGFSFYRHEVGRPYVPRDGGANRLLVAASPNDFVADTHWLRSDVDRFFVERARQAGVTVIEGAELDRVRNDGSVMQLGGVFDGDSLRVETALVVDGSGEGGFLRRHLPIEKGPALRTQSTLLYGHFRNVPLLADVVAGEADWAAPYPEDWAAVHHLLDEGWIYLLRFDDGLVSAGALLAGPDAHVGEEPADQWDDLLRRYPTLEALFSDVEIERPIAAGRVQRRLARAHGRRWVLLPHSYGFVDPLFSTGIAWSLIGVERLADSLCRLGPDAEQIARGEAFDRYAGLLAAEIRQVDRLVRGAYRARHDFDLFSAQAMLYFAVVSYEESLQRLSDPPSPCWRGFLGAGDARLESLFAKSTEQLERMGHGDAAAEAAFVSWVRDRIEPWNVAGLAVPERANLYPVDFEDLVAAATKLGLTSEAVRAAVPRLRGAAVD